MRWDGGGRWGRGWRSLCRWEGAGGRAVGGGEDAAGVGHEAEGVEEGEGGDDRADDEDPLAAQGGVYREERANRHRGEDAAVVAEDDDGPALGALAGGGDEQNVGLDGDEEEALAEPGEGLDQEHHGVVGGQGEQGEFDDGESRADEEERFDAPAGDEAPPGQGDGEGVAEEVEGEEGGDAFGVLPGGDGQGAEVLGQEGVGQGVGEDTEKVERPSRLRARADGLRCGPTPSRSRLKVRIRLKKRLESRAVARKRAAKFLPVRQS